MFADEIREQPAALRDLIRAYGTGTAAARLDQLAALRAIAAAREDVPPGPVIFTGMGSSLYAADAVVPRLIVGGIDASVREAGEWLHYGMTAVRQAGLVIAISQSGESVETRMLAEQLAGRVPVAAVTNDPESSMARAARVVLPLHAGREEMISVKTYSNSLGVLHLAGAALLGEDLGETLDALAATAAAMEQALDPALEPLIGEAAQWLDEARCIHALARGPALAAAREGALVLGEGAHLAVTALPAGSFRHGPMELMGPGHVALLFAPSGPTRELMERLAIDLVNAGSRVIRLSDQASAEGSPNQVTFPLTGSPGEAYLPLPAAIIIERLLAGVAERRGLVPGQFRFGGKITAAE
jgi:glutamine---fructose-6-phosphate transaminase (isomerizing)